MKKICVQKEVSLEILSYKPLEHYIFACLFLEARNSSYYAKYILKYYEMHYLKNYSKYQNFFYFKLPCKVKSFFFPINFKKDCCPFSKQSSFK